jgi:cbb3-type cytochrome oxidase subunit 3
MSLVTWHAALTIGAMLGFIAVVGWAYAGDARRRFEAVSRLALEEDPKQEGDRQ